MRERRTRLQGLTLIELMVVLVVMGVLVGAALPAMGNAIADRRVANVARDIVGLFNRARYMSVAYGRAHQVHYFNGAGIGAQPWAFETIRGTGGACFVSSFASGGNVIGDFDCSDADHWRCVDRLYADDYDPTPADADFVMVDGGPDEVFCYEGGVNNYLMNNGAALDADWLTAPSRAARGFVIFRQRGNNDVGVARKVVIPFGSGAPRVLQ